jgi:iron complex outermembrane receptor protein
MGIKFFKGALVASTVLSANAAFAQEIANPADIVVTARRTEERLQDVPISISVVNQEQLQQRNISALRSRASRSAASRRNRRRRHRSASISRTSSGCAAIRARAAPTARASATFSTFRMCRC